MKKILRLTRHALLREQDAELRRIFGSDLEIIQVSETVPDVARVLAIIEEHRPDVVEVILPHSLTAALTRAGLVIPIIRAITRRVLHEDGTKDAPFSHYERIIRLDIVSERL